MVQILVKSVKNWVSNCSSKIWLENSAKCSVAKSCAKDSNGVYMVVVVNNIPNVKPAVIYMPFKSTHTWIWCVISAWKVGLNWGLCKLLDICNGTWDWKTETEHSEVMFFVILWKHVMDLRIEQLKLSRAKSSFLLYCGNM